MRVKFEKYYKLGLLIFFLIVLCLPALQKRYHIFDVSPLMGAVGKPAQPVLNNKNWYSGDFQTKETDKTEKTIGFRPLFVRLHNQLQYDLFGKVNAKGVLIGKDGYMFEHHYIESYLGEDYIGEDSIQKKVDKLIKIKDTLQNLGTKLVLIIAPGKGAFYPEYFPLEDASKKRGTTNYEVYLRDLSKTSINVIDYQQWFLAHKGKMKYPLFTKNGIHWSYYSEVLVADSILKYMQKLLPNYQVPQIEITGIIADGKTRHRDGDIGQGANLFYTGNNKLLLGYPQFKLIKKDGKHPKVLVVSDSFYWGMFNWGMSRDIFDNGDFWYYNKEIYPESYKKPLFVKDIDLKKRLESNKAIILMTTSGNLYKFAFGFIDQVYSLYYPKK